MTSDVLNVTDDNSTPTHPRLTMDIRSVPYSAIWSGYTSVLRNEYHMSYFLLNKGNPKLIDEQASGGCNSLFQVTNNVFAVTYEHNYVTSHSNSISSPESLFSCFFQHSFHTSFLAAPDMFVEVHIFFECYTLNVFFHTNYILISHIIIEFL